MFRTALVLSLIAGAASAATPPPIEQIPGSYRDRDEGPRAPQEQLFISPSGEPFRAPPGEAYPVAAWFAKTDANGDGAIDAVEFQADQLRFFDQLDVDKDGVIDAFESEAYEKEIAPEVTGRFGGGAFRPHRHRRGFLGFGGRPKGPRLGGLHGAAPYALINEPLPVRAADANFDFRISREEQVAASNRRFDLLDENNDGRIDRSEVKPTAAQVAPERDEDDKR